MRVLVADDHSLFRDGLVSLLEVAGYTVVGQAGDGQAAVNQAFSLQPDLILLDLHMPIMNGLEALRHIKERQPATFVVMLTVSDDESHLVDAMKAGANGYLYKHLKLAGISACVGRPPTWRSGNLNEKRNCGDRKTFQPFNELTTQICRCFV